MRNFLFVCVVALIVAGGVAFAVGLVTVAVDQPEGKYIVNLTVNTAMLHHGVILGDQSATHRNDEPSDISLTTKGKIMEVRPEKNQVVVSESFKSWTFQLATDGKVFVNDHESKLAALQTGDDATVTFDRHGPQLVASVIRSTRK